MIKQILAVAAVILLTSTISAHALKFSLDASTPGTGPGSTVGWGFNVTNDSSTDWVSLSYSEFNTPSTIGDPAVGLQGNGYTDFIVLNGGYLLAPGGTLSQAFNAATLSGVGSFTFDTSPTVIGQTASGTIDLHYDAYSVDPTSGLFDPDTDFIGPFIASQNADASPTPEPGTMLLLGSGLAAAVMRRKMKKAAQG